MQSATASRPLGDAFAGSGTTREGELVGGGAGDATVGPSGSASDAWARLSSILGTPVRPSLALGAAGAGVIGTLVWARLAPTPKDRATITTNSMRIPGLFASDACSSLLARAYAPVAAGIPPWLSARRMLPDGEQITYVLLLKFRVAPNHSRRADARLLTARTTPELWKRSSLRMQPAPSGIGTSTRSYER